MAKKPETGAKTAAKAAKKPAAKTASTQATGIAGKQRGLGRGLSSLLGDAAVAATASSTEPAAAEAVTGLTEIPIEWINVGPWQPRRKFDQVALKELAESIRSKGLVQPILVRPSAKSQNRYELIAGERRWRAAQMAQIHKIPAIIRELSDEDAYEVALIENIQRADLSVIEEAQGYRQLIDTFGYKQEQLSEIIGKSRSHIANLLRLLTLPEDVINLLTDGALTMGQARPLVGHDNASALASEIVSFGLSARQAEALAAKPPSKDSTRNHPRKDADIRRLENRLQENLGIKVSIEWNDQKERGRLTMKLGSLEQFDAVVRQLGIS